jgi:UPF0755 protein
METKKRANKKNKYEKILIFFCVFLFLIILSTLISSCGLFEEENNLEDVPGVDVEFEIKEGMTLKEIAVLLEERNIVDNAFLFRLFVEQEGKEGSLIPGSYLMKTGSEYGDVLSTITAGAPVVTYEFTIPEGYTAKQVIEKIAAEIPFVKYEELKKVEDISNYNYEFLKESSTLEGFLFPKTYEITIDYTAKNIIEMMLAQYQMETGGLDYSYAQEKGMSNYDILKIASMIEREAYIPEERALISAVIHNRLDIDMKLDIDAILCYYLDKWDEGLNNDDKNTDSPYNTYMYAGLPPTPICNPGIASIDAALHPSDVDYLYFVVTDSEKHIHSFSSNLQEHEENRSRAE